MDTFQFVTLLYLVPACLSRSLSDNVTELANLKTQVHQLQDQLGNISNILQNGNVKVGPNVHFFARMSGTKTLNMNSIVVFDEEIDDYDNNYNRGDGIFVAPVTGFYQFSWTLFTASKKNIYTELRVDNFVIDVAYDYSSAGSTSVSKTVICKVKKGNHVWIQTGGQYSENYFYKYVGSKNSFMGLLLHEANS